MSYASECAQKMVYIGHTKLIREVSPQLVSVKSTRAPV